MTGGNVTVRIDAEERILHRLATYKRTLRVELDP